MSTHTNSPSTGHRAPPFTETAGTYAPRETEYPGTHVSIRRRDDAMRMETIEFYTRLRKRGNEFREINNIWNDPEARDRVRAAAKGNETVPTVHIGDRWLVNPTIKDVAATIRPITIDNSPPAGPTRDEDRRTDRPSSNPSVSLVDSRTTVKDIPELRHHLQELVHAARDIRIYRTTVIACGAPGIVVAIHANPGRETYTVEFEPTGLAGATIRVGGLTDADLQGRAPPG